MSISGTTRLNQFLTNLSIAYPIGNKIGQMVSPIFNAAKYAGQIYRHGSDQFAQRTTRAESAPSNHIDFATGTAINYRTYREALNSVFTDKEADNADIVAQYKMEHTNNLTEILLNNHETRISAILTDNSQVTQYVALSSTGQFDHASYAGDFEKNIITAKKTIFNGSKGVRANTIVIPYEVALYMSNLSWIKDIKYVHPLQLIQGNLPGQQLPDVTLPPVIKGLRVVIPDGLVNDSNKGITESLSNFWGKNILIGYVPPSTGLKMSFGLVTAEHKSRQVYEERLTDPYGTKIITDWDYDIVIGDLKCWYLVQTAIS